MLNKGKNNKNSFLIRCFVLFIWCKINAKVKKNPFQSYIIENKCIFASSKCLKSKVCDKYKKGLYY